MMIVGIVWSPRLFFFTGVRTEIRGPITSCRLRFRHDILAFLASAGFLVVEESLVSFRHRVSAVVADHTLLLVQQCIAIGAVPLEAIDLTVAPLTLDH